MTDLRKYVFWCELETLENNPINEDIYESILVVNIKDYTDVVLRAIRKALPMLTSVCKNTDFINVKKALTMWQMFADDDSWTKLLRALRNYAFRIERTSDSTDVNSFDKQKLVANILLLNYMFPEKKFFDVLGILNLSVLPSRSLLNNTLAMIQNAFSNDLYEQVLDHLTECINK